VTAEAARGSPGCEARQDRRIGRAAAQAFRPANAAAPGSPEGLRYIPRLRLRLASTRSQRNRSDVLICEGPVEGGNVALHDLVEPNQFAIEAG